MSNCSQKSKGSTEVEVAYPFSIGHIKHQLILWRRCLIIWALLVVLGDVSYLQTNIAFKLGKASQVLYLHSSLEQNHPSTRMSASEGYYMSKLANTEALEVSIAYQCVSYVLSYQ